ncbi:MAG: hypothetical protein ACRDQZ_09280 [Mycobacteriales bacterium]
MKREQYDDAWKEIIQAMRLILAAPLVEIKDEIAVADAVGPITHPSEYRDTLWSLDLQREIATIMLRAQDALRGLRDREGAQLLERLMQDQLKGEKKDGNRASAGD